MKKLYISWKKIFLERPLDDAQAQNYVQQKRLHENVTQKILDFL